MKQKRSCRDCRLQRPACVRAGRLQGANELTVALVQVQGGELATARSDVDVRP
jgi:hypothetical protein